MSEPVAGLPAVDTRGQGGLLDVAIDPAFATNQLIYWSYAEPRDGGMNNTAVARGRFVDGAAPKVENVQVIFHQAPSLNSRPLSTIGRSISIANSACSHFSTGCWMKRRMNRIPFWNV